VKQIGKLGQKIFRRVKPKKMNGRYLDGVLLLEICRNYEQAINSGNIPNIESAWSGLCKSETLKAFQQAETILLQEEKKFSDGRCLAKAEMK